MNVATVVGYVLAGLGIVALLAIVLYAGHVEEMIRSSTRQR